jgi:hypothetical protein
MPNTLPEGWTDSGADELEAALTPDPGALLLLGSGASRRFGGPRHAPDLRCGPLRVRIGRKPTALNLRALYKRRGRGVPEEFDVFWSHELWMLHHTVGLLRDEDTIEARGLQYEMVLDERAVIQGVMPEERAIRQSPAGADCRAEVLLNGRMVPDSAEAGGEEELENLAGGALTASTRDDVVGRVWLPVMTSHVQAIGPGCNVATWMFRGDAPLEGYQPMATTLLLDKHIRTLSCKVQVRLHAVGRNGVVIPLARSGWAAMTLDLGAQAPKAAAAPPE